jgi:putative ABC transport system ATP-binding protein
MLLSMRDINKDYIQGKNTVKVLNEVSLDVEEGEYLAIMGPSGSGKTTLMNIIGYLDVPTSGNYSFDGEEFSGAKDNKLAEVRNKKIGFVFQKYYLLPKLTALDNVALPLLYRGISKKERNKMAAEALKMVGLEDRMNFYPNQLSGGQCQRVSIARAIAGNPKLILADEPTGALDTNSGNQIMEIFRDLNEKGSTIIMITHESEIAKKANKIKHILDGKIIEDSRKDGASNE